MDSDILQSTFNELKHLVIPPAELTIEEDVELGVGAYGEVFFATLNRNSTSVKVAVKQLRIAQAKGVRRRIAIRLARELKVWATANHPNILALVGFYVSDNYGCAQLVSPLMSNGNVNKYIEGHQPSVVTRLRLITGIASGMNYLHTCDPPICHGDLKPSNVLVKDNIEAVLCDFGLANFVLESGAATGLSTTSVKGCPRYMSPELFSDEAAKHTLESDMWAWACTAFEIVAYVHPFHLLKTDGAVILALLEGKPPGSSSLLDNPALGAYISCPMGQDSLKSVITGCWNMDPGDRPRSSDIARRMLDLGCYDGQSPSASQNAPHRLSLNFPNSTQKIRVERLERYRFQPCNCPIETRVPPSQTARCRVCKQPCSRVLLERNKILTNYELDEEPSDSDNSQPANPPAVISQPVSAPSPYHRRLSKPWPRRGSASP